MIASGTRGETSGAHVPNDRRAARRSRGRRNTCTDARTAARLTAGGRRCTRPCTHFGEPRRLNPFGRQQPSPRGGRNRRADPRGISLVLRPFLGATGCRSPSAAGHCEARQLSCPIAWRCASRQSTGRRRLLPIGSRPGCARERVVTSSGGNVAGQEAREWLVNQVDARCISNGQPTRRRWQDQLLAGVPFGAKESRKEDSG